MVTGANSGLGKSIATFLAKKGGTVHMICRNEERAKKARDEIVRECGNEVPIMTFSILFVTRYTMYNSSIYSRTYIFIL